MATSGARRRPQKYPDELRERAVRMVLEIREEPGDHVGVIGRVAKQLGIGVESLRGWVKQAESDGGRKAGTSTADSQRMFELERENRELRRANDMAESTGGRTGCWNPAAFSITGATWHRSSRTSRSSSRSVCERAAGGWLTSPGRSGAPRRRWV